MKKKAVEEVQEKGEPSAPAAAKRRKRKRGGRRDAATRPVICDDVLPNILARLPARSTVASMALSKHYHALICNPEFRSLHCRLAPPLPEPHIAFMATDPARGYHGFHVAGAGLSSNVVPVRALSGEKYAKMKYINTCNGILLFSTDTISPTCVLWNPAVADEHKEVTIPYTGKSKSKTYGYERGLLRGCDAPGEYSILGLGYGRMSNTYKLILSLRRKLPMILESNPPKSSYSKALMVYTLGVSGEEPRFVTLLSPMGMDRKIGPESLHIDGIIYILAFLKSTILAFDVDHETLVKIDLPGGCLYNCKNRLASELVQVSGRPCLVKNDDGRKALWLLTVDHQWEQRCIIDEGDDYFIDKRVKGIWDDYFIDKQVKGIWDYAGVLLLVLRFYHRTGHANKLLLYQVATQKILEANMPRDLIPAGDSNYAFCWGYRPTLVSPGSIVGEIEQDIEAHLDRLEAPKPVNKQEDKRKGQKATLDIVCFMGFLIRTMQKMPEKVQHM